MRYPSQSLVVLHSSGCQCWRAIVLSLGLLYLAGTRHSPASGETRSSQAVRLFHIYVLFKVPSTLCMGLTSKKTLQGQSFQWLKRAIVSPGVLQRWRLQLLYFWRYYISLLFSNIQQYSHTVDITYGSEKVLMWNRLKKKTCLNECVSLKNRFVPFPPSSNRWLDIKWNL